MKLQNTRSYVVVLGTSSVPDGATSKKQCDGNAGTERETIAEKLRRWVETGDDLEVNPLKIAAAEVRADNSSDHETVAVLFLDIANEIEREMAAIREGDVQ